VGKAAEPERYSSRRKSERDLKLDYFSHVFADFCRLPKKTRDELRADLPPSLRKLVEESENSGEIDPEDEAQLDWGEIGTLEDRILNQQDETALKRRAWQVRARYARLVGPERYALYMASRPPDENDARVSLDALREDLRRLLASTHFTYSLTLVRENNRRRVMRKVGYWTLVLCLGALAFALLLDMIATTKQPDQYILQRAPLLATLFSVVLFGCLGAYLSVQRRLQESADGGDPVIGILGLHEFSSIQPFPLVAGGLFAIVLYFIIAAGFMTGTLFPDLLPGGVPAGIIQWAKLFIWAFLAGFAERLVPDTLDRLVNQAQIKGSGTTIVTQSTQLAGGGAGAQKPGITKIDPRLVTPGSTITIEGGGFGAAQGSGHVRFNGMDAASIDQWSDTVIQARLAPQLMGAVEVEVTLESGDRLAAPADQMLTVDTE
jgi:hypothetical protein